MCAFIPRFVTALALTWGLLAVGSASTAEPVPEKKPRLDRYGDPLPTGAIARLGTIRLRREDGAACDFAFTPDGKALVSARNPRVVQFWDVKTGKPLQEFRHQNAFDTFALSANGKLLAVGNRDEILIWDVPKRKQFRKIAVKDADESLIVFS
ncbi:MAG: WD40 repeat domain-containing protein, partial [Gemmataceae bacterium]